MNVWRFDFRTSGSAFVRVRSQRGAIFTGSAGGVGRRHLNETQRAVVAGRVANIKIGDNQFTLGSANLPTLPVSQSEAAAMLALTSNSCYNYFMCNTKAGVLWR